MTTIRKLQSIMDENKAVIPEGVYLQLCDQMKDLFQESKDEDALEYEGIYEIEYEVVTCVPDKSENTFRLEIEQKERLIELNEEEYKLMSEAELNNSFITDRHCCADIIRKIEPLYHHIYVRPTHDEIKGLDFDDICNNIMPSSAEDIEDGIRDLSIHLGFRKTINLIHLKKY